MTRKLLLALLLVLLTTASGCSAQQPPPQHMLTRFERTGTTLDGWDWASAPWTGDDKPYQKLREDIRLVVAKDAQPLLDQYKAEAEAKPKDPLAQFAWGYAALRTPALVGHENVTVDVSGLPDALAAAPFPRTYNYARLRFLAQAQVRPNAQLEDLGRRLLKRDPTDPAVMYQQIRVLEQTGAKPQNTEALGLAKTLVEAYPSQLAYLQKLANVYDETYIDSGFHKEDAEKAIATYEKYLRLAPPDDPQRKTIGDAIADLRKDVSHDP